MIAVTEVQGLKKEYLGVNDESCEAAAALLHSLRGGGRRLMSAYLNNTS